MESNSRNLAGSANVDSRPDSWRQTLSKARKHFGAQANCLGVNYCERRKGANQEFVPGKHVIAVYVRKKKKLKYISEDELIDGFDDFATDVVEVFSKDRPVRHLDYIKDQYRSHDLGNLDFTKINADHLARERVLPETGRIGRVGDVCIVEDKDGRLVTDENGETVPDLVEAYKVFAGSYGDEFDFVTFFADTSSGMPSFDTSFHWGVHNNIQGIGRNSYDYRPMLGDSSRLQSIHFIHPTQMNRYVMLQEVGHRWGAFVAFRDQDSEADQYDLLIQSGAGAFAHWNIFFDNDSSPMDYDVVDWLENPDGSFHYETVPQRNRNYCNLDLYLMGLIDAREVGDFYFLRDVQVLAGDRYAATKKVLNTRNIMLAEGKRKPDRSGSQKAFRQAFVLLTRDFENAKSNASTIDRFRSEFTFDFADATRNLARIDSSLGSAGMSKGFIRQEYARKTPIPDRSAGSMPQSIEREFYFAAEDLVSGIEVSVDISHTFVGDLQISLIGPNNSVVKLHNQARSSADGIRATYTDENTPALLSYIGKPARGSWKLRITDDEEADEGTLNYWNLKLEFGGPAANEMMVARDQIERTIAEASRQDAVKLQAALTLLVMDMKKYLGSHQREDAATFLRMIDPVIEEEQSQYPDSPLFDLPEEMPSGMATNAAQGTFSPSVFDENIVHEFTVNPGRKLQERFAENFKATICGKNGPYEQLNNNLLGQVTLPATIVSAILTSGFSFAPLWVPIAVYSSLLLTKAGLKTYCES